MTDPDSALYAFLLHDPLREATERAGAILALKTKAIAKVTKFLHEPKNSGPAVLFSTATGLT